jgi:Flp pilus assembly protein TadG
LNGLLRAKKPIAAPRRNQHGAVAIEFAIILPVLATLMLGMVQYGYYFFATQSASSAAREAARRLVVGDCQATGSAQSFARNQAMLSSLTLVYGDATSNTMNNVLPDVGRVVRVKVAASGDILGYLPMPNGGAITRTVDALVEDKAGEGTCP